MLRLFLNGRKTAKSIGGVNVNCINIIRSQNNYFPSKMRYLHHQDWLKLEYDIPCNLTERWEYLESWKAIDISKNSQLTNVQKQRAEVIFSQGETRALQKAFHTLFKFRKKVTKGVDEIMANVDSSLTLIGLHMRHWKVHDLVYNTQLRKLVVNESLKLCGRRCGVLIASDREMELEFLKLDLKSANADIQIFTTKKELKPDKMKLMEHGNFTGNGLEVYCTKKKLHNYKNRKTYVR